jgi:hypothetical protein
MHVLLAPFCIPNSTYAALARRSCPLQSAQSGTHKPTAPSRPNGLAPAGLLLLAGPVVGSTKSSRLTCSRPLHTRSTLRDRALLHTPCSVCAFCAAVPGRMCTLQRKHRNMFMQASHVWAGTCWPAAPSPSQLMRRKTADWHAPATAYTTIAL